MTPQTQKGPKLRSVFWKKNFPKDGTVWADIKLSNRSSELLDVEMDVLKDLFTQKERAPPSAAKTKEADATQPAVVRFQLVQDLTRANNIAIMLKSFASFGDPLAIKTAILQGDDSLTERHIEQLKQMAPRPQEMEKIADFAGKPSDLHLPEQFLMMLGDIPRLERKLNVLLFKKQFDALIAGANRGMDALNEACRQIKESRRLKCVFASILASGNALNADTVRAGAMAIKLESILALSGVKVVTSSRDETDDAEDDAMPNPKLKTLLDYVSWKVMCEELSSGHVDDESLRIAAHDGFLFQELGVLRQAVLLVESDVKQSVEALENCMKLIADELKAEEAVHSGNGSDGSSTAPGPGGTLAVSLASRLESAAGAPLPTSDLNTNPYLNMLRIFFERAKAAEESVLALADRTNAAQDDIVSWMGERGSTDAPGVLKGLLDFSRDFDSSFSRVYTGLGAKGVRAWAERFA